MSDLAGRTSVWDSSALHHALKCDRLDVLLDHAAKLFGDGSPRTTATVADELASYGLALPATIEVDHVDDLETLPYLFDWLGRLGENTSHNRGEATVLAVTQRQEAVAVMDDRQATRVARRQGVQVLGTVGLLAQTVRYGHQREETASNLADQFIQAGARYPFPRHGFGNWARSQSLL